MLKQPLKISELILPQTKPGLGSRPDFDLKKTFYQLSLKPKGGISPTDWTGAIKILTAQEIEPGGPYRDENGRIDPGLNHLIARFLKQQGISLPNLKAYLEPDFKKPIPNNKPALIGKGINDKLDRAIYESIKHSLRQELKCWPRMLRVTGQKELALIQTSDHDRQIALLSLFFLCAQRRENDRELLALAERLGQANTYLWLAYKIYDDLLDREASIGLFPIANLAFNNFLAIIHCLNLPRAGRIFFNQALARLEAYNYQEYQEAKAYYLGRKKLPEADLILESLAGLYQKSFAHAFGPLALLLKESFKITGQEFQSLTSFFINYLNARQLADDLHDWPDDWRRQKINPVLLLLFSTAGQVQAPAFNPDPNWRRIFFHKTWPLLNQKLFFFLDQARTNLHELRSLANPGRLEKLLTSLASGAKQDLAQYRILQELRADWLGASPGCP